MGGAASDSVKRLLFVGYFLSTDTAWLEAYAIRECLLAPIEQHITQHLRAVLADKATWQPEGEYLHLRTLSAEDLRKYWGVAKFALELRIARLRWLQKVLAEPTNHVQRLCAILGDVAGDSFLTVGKDGTLHPLAEALGPVGAG